MSKTILLTGATGFLGGHLARFWVEKGYRVVALTRALRKTKILDPVFDKIIWFTYDLGIEKPFHKYQFEAVVHTAGIYGRKGETLSNLVKVNVCLGLEVLQAALKASVPKFINTGTSLPPVTNDYAISKAQFVEWLQSMAEETATSLINIRLEHMYGPFDDGSKFVTWLIQNMLADKPELKLTTGEQKRDFIYIDDVVSAFDAMLKADMSNGFHQFNVGSGNAVAIRNVVKKVRVLCTCKTKLRFGAAPCRADEPDCLEADTTALSDLGWRSRNSLEEGLTKTIKWEKQCLPI